MDCISINGVKAEVARTFLERAKGLIGRRSLEPGRGLLIPRCNCIHTFFMRFPVDAVFFDRQGNAVKIVRGVRPWRAFVWGGWRAVKVLETAASGVGEKHKQETVK